MCYSRHVTLHSHLSAHIGDAVWKALGDANRRALLDLLLREGPQTTGALCAMFEGEMSRFAVMKHLGVLEAAGLVHVRREGRQVWHQLNPEPLQTIRDQWLRGYGG